jgi:hypothetical protein
MTFPRPHFPLALIVAAVLGLGMGEGEAQQGRRLVLGGGKPAVFGLVVAGAENSTPYFPTASDWAYIQRKGVKTVALTFAWENAQSSLGGSLTTAYVNNLKSAITAANAHGVGVILRMQNYGFYCPSTMWGSTCTTAGNAGTLTAGMNQFGDGTLTSTQFANVWSQLTAALVGTPGLIGYDIMNEPMTASQIGVGGAKYITNLFCAPNYLGATNATTGDVCNWYTFNSPTVTQLALGTNPINSAYGPAWQLTNVSGGYGAIVQYLTLTANPYSFFCDVQAVTGTVPITFYIGADNQARTATTTWQRLGYSVTAAAGGQNVYLQISSGTTGQALNIADCQLEQAGSPSTYQPNPYQTYAQAAITAVRTYDTVEPIYIEGFAFGYWGANWQQYNWDLIALTDPSDKLIFEDHLYFDGAPGIGDGGNYSGTYTSYATNAQAGVTQASNFVQWLGLVNAKGQVGEFGIPNSSADANASWFPLQMNFMRYLYANRVPATMEFYGANNAGSGAILQLNPQSGVDDPRLLQMLSVAP